MKSITKVDLRFISSSVDAFEKRLRISILFIEDNESSVEDDVFLKTMTIIDNLKKSILALRGSISLALSSSSSDSDDSDNRNEILRLRDELFYFDKGLLHNFVTSSLSSSLCSSVLEESNK